MLLSTYFFIPFSLLSLSPPNGSQDGVEAVILESRTGSKCSCHVSSEASVSRDKSLGQGKDILRKRGLRLQEIYGKEKQYLVLQPTHITFPMNKAC